MIKVKVKYIFFYPMFVCVFMTSDAHAQQQRQKAQAWLGARHALKNAFIQPLVLVGGSLSRTLGGNSYRSLRKHQDDQILTGDSCEALCPKSFDVMALTDEQTMPTRENSFVFQNHTDHQERFNYKDIYPTRNYYGYCWGHAELSRQFSTLAIFENTCKKHPELNCKAASDQAPSLETQPKEWNEFYQNLISKIANNQARVIPGFKSIQEFSENPAIQKMLLTEVSRSWAKNSMKISSLRVSMRFEAKVKRDLTLVTELIDRLEHHQTPLLVAGGGTPADTHVLVVYGIRGDAKGRAIDSNGNITFCLRDNNAEPESNENCETFLTYGAPAEFRDPKNKHESEPGELVNQGGGTIADDHGRPVNYSAFSLAPHENRDFAQSVKSMQKLCRALRCKFH